MSNTNQDEKKTSNNSKVKKVRIRRQLVIPNLLKNYFVLSVNSSTSARPATHQSEDTCKPCLKEGQFSVYRVCGDEETETSSHTASDSTKRASVIAKRADAKETVKCKVKKCSACSSSLEFVNTEYSPDCLYLNTKIGKSNKMRIHSPDLSNRYSIYESNSSSNTTANHSCTSPFSNSLETSNYSPLQSVLSPNETNLNLTKQECYSPSCTSPHIPQHFQESNNSAQQHLEHPPLHSLYQEPNLNLFLHLDVVEFKQEWDKMVDVETSCMFLLNSFLVNK